MSILVNKNSKVIVQGITGGEDAFHSQQKIDYGSNIVAGVTPGKGGSFILEQNIPVFNSVEEAQSNTDANVSIIFVPPAFASDAIMESASAGIKVIMISGDSWNRVMAIKRNIDFYCTRDVCTLNLD